MSANSESLLSEPKIALALSGGGARAMAFHLGCLRALHDLGILDRVRVLSTVSRRQRDSPVRPPTIDAFKHLDDPFSCI